MVNILSLLIAAAVFAVGYLIHPLQFSFIDYEHPYAPLQKLLTVIALMIVYIFLHEFVHGIFFRKYSGRKASYGFTGLYAFAKSDAYFSKREYTVIGLAPIVIWGAVCLVLNFLLSPALFWYVYAVQIINISGAAGDLYVSYVMTKVPADILVKDSGTSMTIYAK